MNIFDLAFWELPFSVIASQIFIYALAAALIFWRLPLPFGPPSLVALTAILPIRVALAACGGIWLVDHATQDFSEPGSAAIFAGFGVLFLLGCLALAGWYAIRWALALANFGTSPGAVSWPSVGWRIVVSVVLILAPFAFVSWMSWRTHEASKAGLFLRNLHDPKAPVPRISDGEQVLARTFEPLWWFAKDEEWHPTSAAAFLDGATLLRADGSTDPASVIVDPTTEDGPACRRRGAGCMISIGCASESDDACKRERPSARSAVYVHTVRDPLQTEGFAPPRSSPIFGLKSIIEYWTFYRFDEWKADFGLFRQWHEGDWEAVFVGVGSTKPLFVAYTAHCGGQWRRWSTVGRLAGTRGQDSVLRPNGRAFAYAPGYHPIAFVAEGTHGAYPDDSQRAPDWASCEAERRGWGDAKEVSTWGPSFGIGLYERLDQQLESNPDMYGPPIVMASEDPASRVMQFNGLWGAHGGLELPPPLPDGTDSGADTPSLKGLWNRPVRQIFCGRFWHPHMCPPLAIK